jgi:hypothetical protein
MNDDGDVLWFDPESGTTLVLRGRSLENLLSVKIPAGWKTHPYPGVLEVAQKHIPDPDPWVWPDTHLGLYYTAKDLEIIPETCRRINEMRAFE